MCLLVTITSAIRLCADADPSYRLSKMRLIVNREDREDHNKTMISTRRSFPRLKSIIIALFCFCLDRFGLIVGNGYRLFFTPINYCVSLVLPEPRGIRLFNALLVFLTALATGYGIMSTVLFLIFTAVSTALLKKTLTETTPIFMVVITFYVWFYSLITGSGGLWTISQFVANIIIIYVLLKLTQKRRAIA